MQNSNDNISLHWIVRTGDDSKAQEFFLKENVIALPWPKMGDLSLFASQQSIRTALSKHYPEVNSGATTAYASQLFSFATAMNIGEFVIYPIKLSSTIYLGVIAGPYEFDTETSVDRPHKRYMRWTHSVDRSKLPSRLLQRLGSPLQLSRARLKPNDLKLLKFA